MKFRSTMMLMAGLALGAFVGPGHAAPNDGRGVTPVVRAAILSIIEAQDAAWKAGDAEAFCAAATPDVVFTNVVGMFSVGHAPMVAQHARIFSTIYQGSVLKQTIVNLALVRPDVAIVDTLTEVSGFKHLPPGSEAIDGVLKTRLEQVMVMETGRWRVASFHDVTINAAAMAGGPPK